MSIPVVSMGLVASEEMLMFYADVINEMQSDDNSSHTPLDKVN